MSALVNKIRARQFGQLELRRNLDDALRAAKMSRACAAREAGIKYTHLVGALAGDVWLTRGATSALADMLAMSLEELVGDSIFKDEVDRYIEFQGRPHARQFDLGEAHDGIPEIEVPGNRTRALCCNCGRLRLYDYKWVPGQVHDLEPEQRMLTELPCDTCGDRTWHAVLRDHNAKYRDCAEERMYPAPQGHLALEELRAQIELVSGFNVDVHWSSTCLHEEDREKGYCVVAKWDRAKSRWRLELEPSAPPAVLTTALRSAWSRLAKGDDMHRYMFGASDAWSYTTNCLLSDIEVFSSAERRRAIDHHVREALDSHQSGERP